MLKAKKKLKDPVVYYPSELKKNDFTGIVYGVRIKETNQYNIVSLGESEQHSKNTEIIGKIVNEKTKNNLTEDEKIIGVKLDDTIEFYDSKGVKCKKEPYTLKLDVFSRNTGILENDFMLKSGVIITGVGSVGSLIALELARSGVGRFLLVDNDVMAYHNICRHQCGIYDVGKYKTEAVKERILQINPEAEIITFEGWLQSVPKNIFDDFCDENTMILGCADNREGDLYANSIAKTFKMPLMSVGFWERAFAGEIFYCYPEGMPDYEDFYDSLGETSGRATQNRKFYTTEEDLEKTFFEPGISVDINFVTTVSIKLMIDILNRNNNNYHPKLIDKLTQFTLICNTNDPVIGGDLAEIFSYPLQVTTSIQVGYSSKPE
jgi:molybdopterin/thiamine biosynthesis adenylyltransferase